MNTRALRSVLSAAPLALLLSACIVKDETMSFYIRPDGSVDALIVSDNVRSDKEGPEAGKEEREWLTRFKGGDADHEKELRAAGAGKVRTELLRDEAPYSAVVRARLASAADLARFFGMDGKEDKSSLSWTSEGDRRELRFRIAGSTSSLKDPGSAPAGESQESRTTVRFVAVGGRIAASQGFAVSADSTTATLDWKALDAAEKKGGPYDLFLAWRAR